VPLQVAGRSSRTSPPDGFLPHRHQENDPLIASAAGAKGSNPSGGLECADSAGKLVWHERSGQRFPYGGRSYKLDTTARSRRCTSFRRKDGGIRGRLARDPEGQPFRKHILRRPLQRGHGVQVMPSGAETVAAFFFRPGQQ